MAKGKKTGGKNFEPGNKMGLGAVAHNPEIKKLRNLTHQEITEIGSLLFDSSQDELREIRDGNVALRSWFAAIILDGIKHSSMGTLNALLDRVVGKVPDNLNLSGIPPSTPVVLTAVEYAAFRAKFDSEY